MNYTDNSCLVCGRKFNEADDVVVCPICGTPHHRECWQEHGRCINEEKHSEGYIWQAAAAAPEAITEEIPQQNSTNAKICPECGFANDITEPVCTRCGARLKLGSAQFNPFGGNVNGQWNAPPTQQYNPYHNVYAYDAKALFGEDACIEDIPVTECAEYIQKNANKYIADFVAMEESGSKLRWNWAAGLASVFWCFYRKMYGAGAALMAIFFSLYLASSFVPALVCEQIRPDIYEDYNNTLELLVDEMNDIIENGYSDPDALTTYYGLMARLIKSPISITSYVIQAASVLIIGLITGFFGNHLYKKKMVKDIHSIRRVATDNMVYHIYLKQKGNVSVINLLFPIMLHSLFTTILSYF